MTLLDPERRSLYVDALRPPPERVFDRGVATTYSLDLDTLLSLPLHLVLYASESPREELLQDGVALLDALRRTTSRLAVYCDRGRIAVPRAHRILFSLLEPVLHEVDLRAAGLGAGAFHPKVWLLRFVHPEGAKDGRRAHGAGGGSGAAAASAPDGAGAPVYRLVVLTRNVTGDASWDVGLTLEGSPGERPWPAHEPLTAFLRTLTRLAPGRPDPDRPPLLGERLHDELRRVRWDVPDGFDDLRFHFLHPGRDRWLPPASDRLAVVSPFLGAAALDTLADTTREPVALVSRLESLAGIHESTRHRFGAARALHDAAERDDGEEPERDGPMTNAGLHAKVYLAETGREVRLITGSANATDAVVRANMNVEFLVELVGRRADGNGIDAFLGPEGFGALLMEVDDRTLADVEEPDESTERLLESGRSALRGARLRLLCIEDAEDLWRLELRSELAFDFPPELTLRAWPVTLPPDHARDATALPAGEPVDLGNLAPQSLTGLLALELRIRDGSADERLRFVLNVPVEGLPEAAREAALTRQIVANEESFLRYLLLLLSDLDVETGRSDLLGSLDFGGNGSAGIDFDELPIVEEMARAYARSPDRLDAVDGLVRRLSARTREAIDGGHGGDRGHRGHGGHGDHGGDGGAAPPDGSPERGVDDVIPDDFRRLWDTFQEALESRS